MAVLHVKRPRQVDAGRPPITSLEPLCGTGTSRATRNGRGMSGRMLDAGMTQPSGKVASPETPVRSSLTGVSTAHLVGICGAGMKALAELLAGRGLRVTGSDQQPTAPLLASMRRRGVRVHRGHAGTHLPPGTDVLIHSLAIGSENAERRRAGMLGIPQWSYSETIGRLMAERVGVSVAGTHGKSTTTAMIASLLERSGRQPSVVVGAELIERGASGWAGAGELFVAESCEYRRSFLDLAPRFAVILGIEADHFDCYASLEESQQAFGEFSQRVDTAGVLLVPADCPVTRAAVAPATVVVRTFGRRCQADWWAADVRRTTTGSRFRLFYRGGFLTEISLQVPGRHNVDNALAAAALSLELGVDHRDVREGLHEFTGIRRRFQHVGSWRGVTVIDDYAHHPTAVRVTLETARETFGRRRLWCALQPHQISRTVTLLEELAGSFDCADEVLILPVYAAREEDRCGELLGAELADRIGKRISAAPAPSRRRCRFLPSLDRLVTTLDDEARPGDVLVMMGAGDIDRVQHEFTR